VLIKTAELKRDVVDEITLIGLIPKNLIFGSGFGGGSGVGSWVGLVFSLSCLKNSSPK
jgi:hypothetical protein